MAESDDEIPILTDAIERVPPPAAAGSDIDELHAQLCAASLARAEELLRDACREAEHVIIEQTMNALRNELPDIVRGILKEQLKK